MSFGCISLSRAGHFFRVLLYYHIEMVYKWCRFWCSNRQSVKMAIVSGGNGQPAYEFLWCDPLYCRMCLRGKVQEQRKNKNIQEPVQVQGGVERGRWWVAKNKRDAGEPYDRAWSGSAWWSTVSNSLQSAIEYVSWEKLKFPDDGVKMWTSLLMPTPR